MQDAPEMNFDTPATPAAGGAGVGLDVTDNSHLANNCSYPAYVAGKFYEYAAAIEMIYVLATDEAARKQLFTELQGSALARYLSAPRGTAVSNTFGYLREHWFGDPRLAQQYRETALVALEEWGASQDALMASITNALMSTYNEIKRRFHECGFLYGVATLSTDGAFALGELALGAGVAGVSARALKSLRFVVSRRPDGSFAASAHAPGGGTVSRTFSQSELEAKYGTPEQNHTGTLTPDTNRQPGSGPAGSGTPPPFRHPRDGQPPRSREELLPGGRVPRAGQFDAWWNDLSPAEYDSLLSNPATRDTIASRIRGDGGLHEWLKVSQSSHLKRLGFSMEEIRAFTSPTNAVGGPNPLRPGTRWRHSPEGGGAGSGPGSVQMHNSLDELIAGSTSKSDLLRRYGRWANSWLDNGIESLPGPMRDAILRAGGG